MQTFKMLAILLIGILNSTIGGFAIILLRAEIEKRPPLTTWEDAIIFLILVAPSAWVTTLAMAEARRGEYQ